MIVLLDTHVHFYPCYRIDHWIDGMFFNFQTQAAALTFPQQSAVGYGAILTERTSESYFTAWQQHQTLAHCSLESISPTCLVIRHPLFETPLYLYQGRQIKTAEGLEILCLSERSAIPDGLPFQETLTTLASSQATLVLPWSCGKWLGARRALVRNALLTSMPNLFIGDIFGRPWIEPLKQLARATQRRILAGTDPLPQAQDESLAGTKICVIQNAAAETMPQAITNDLFHKHLLSTACQKFEGVLSLVLRQARYQLNQK
jgi:hypothetical protein